LSNPEVAAIVKGVTGHRVYVGREVNIPGMIPILGRLTALQVILQPGGFINTGKLVLLR